MTLLLCSYLTDRKEPFQQGISNLRRHRLLRVVGGLVACCPGLRFIGSLRINISWVVTQVAKFGMMPFLRRSL